MGLDFSHGGGYLWAYSNYGDFIMRLADEATRQPSETKPDPIKPLLDHSCCEGFFEPWECDAIADRMLQLVSAWDDYGDPERERAELMAKGLRRAAARDERFLYL
jgi:hypothetical protein